MIPTPNKEILMTNIQKFKKLDWPDHDLVKKILESLGIYDIVELEVTMNSLDKRERLAAMKMVERNLDDLLSGKSEIWADAKDTLQQIYYKVEEVDEEGFL